MLDLTDNKKEKLSTFMTLGLEAFKVFMACMLSLFVSQKCDDHISVSYTHLTLPTTPYE